MKPYVVKQGDYLDKIAHALGFDPADAWNDPKNAELKKQRDPNLLHPGDILYVPERHARECFPLAACADNVFIAKVPRTKVHVVLKDLHKPRANEAYTVYGMGEPEEGVTDADGGLTVDAPVHVREIQIVLTRSQVTYPVHIGDMDPIDEPSGVRKRLQHLGYYIEPSGDSGGGDAEASERAAIHAFQMDHDLAPTGTLDDETKAKLLEKHGA